MPIISRDARSYRNDEDREHGVQVNHIFHRKLIFAALKQMYQKEAFSRTLYLDSRRKLRTGKLDSSRTYRQNSEHQEVSLITRICGKSYLVDGFILDKHDGTFNHIQESVRCIPKRSGTPKSEVDRCVQHSFSMLERKLNKLSQEVEALKKVFVTPGERNPTPPNQIAHCESGPFIL